MQAYGLFRSHFSGLNEARVEITQLEKELQGKALENSLLAFQINDLRQNVAQNIKDFDFKNDEYSKYMAENFKNSFRVPASEDKIDFSAAWIERGKLKFREKNYSEASVIFGKVLAQYPASSLATEAHFLLVESWFLQGQYQQSITKIEEMLELYPESELTGFAMLRMGQIFQDRHRDDDAAEIYRTILRSFSNKDLQKQAQLLLTSVGG
jgi:TolA-binding protein